MNSVRPADFSVGMANQTAPVLDIAKGIGVPITRGAAGPLHLGGSEFVVVMLPATFYCLQ